MTTDPDSTTTSAVAGPLDEAYLRLHGTGPEFDGWLSNHGPMAAEALARHGHGEVVESWLDDYMLRLEEFPRRVSPIGTDWQAALGDPRRVADWTALFRAEMSERPWRQVLNTWWPRLLPGVVAAATHGVIRVGHAVRCLLTDGDDQIRTAELAHGLAYSGRSLAEHARPAMRALLLPRPPARRRRRGRPRTCWPTCPVSPSSQEASGTGSPGSMACPAGLRSRPASASRSGRSRSGPG